MCNLSERIKSISSSIKNFIHNRRDVKAACCLVETRFKLELCKIFNVLEVVYRQSMVSNISNTQYIPNDLTIESQLKYVTVLIHDDTNISL